ncbi:hypothetical protein CSIM01_09803 [Colletotrichum simmondsii]|uniref:Uncharacterized protein n=1 Tax=Colletotrichum simmondsii TaxID=703756 RepID=A0A135RX63_9PEZI|nr:hypothetical protein CSIM01_09803 [Colletotrichum simmondsii]
MEQPQPMYPLLTASETADFTSNRPDPATTPSPRSLVGSTDSQIAILAAVLSAVSTVQPRQQSQQLDHAPRTGFPLSQAASDAQGPHGAGSRHHDIGKKGDIVIGRPAPSPSKVRAQRQRAQEHPEGHDVATAQFQHVHGEQQKG